MDNSSEKQTTTNEAFCAQTSDEGEPRNRKLNACNFFQPFWIRRAFCADNELDGFLLDYGRYLLLPIGCVLWAIFLAT